MTAAILFAALIILCCVWCALCGYRVGRRSREQQLINQRQVIESLARHNAEAAVMLAMARTQLERMMGDVPHVGDLTMRRN